MIDDNDSLEFYQWVLFVYFYDPSWPFSFNISKWEASSLDICQTLRIYNAKGSSLTLDNFFTWFIEFSFHEQSQFVVKTCFKFTYE